MDPVAVLLDIPGLLLPLKKDSGTGLLVGFAVVEDFCTETDVIGLLLALIDAVLFDELVDVGDPLSPLTALSI